MKHLIVTTLLLGSLFSQAQGYHYKIDLNDIKEDQVHVLLENIEFKGDELSFQFPKTIPGTYATEDYGKYIENFKAYSGNGEVLKVKQKKYNTFIISEASTISKIEYDVNDTWDSGEKKNAIFEPAGTNFENKKNFVINSSGLFGYFLGTENNKVDVEFKKTTDLYGMSVLPSTSSSEIQKFNADSYHHLVDCPIIFAEPDTANFKVANADVSIAVYAERGGKHSKEIYNELKTSMQAIADFVGELPVDNYSFLIYLKDKSKLGDRIAKEGITPAIIPQLMKLGGVGALEHGNSSFYYLLDMGDVELTGPLAQLKYMETIKSVAIHEFMHIFTPLNLHSEHIGDFNYADPKMSKHLWLYEGITEYFSGQIQLQGGIVTEREYFQNIMRDKILASNKFPKEKMTFTEMSENVLEKKYHKQYMQVYQRGALMGLLLDIEIMKLTNNQKTLKDVIITLSKRYGANQSFDEASFISEFVKEVHPDLQNFFTNYIEGNETLPIGEQLAYIGWEYESERHYRKPEMPWQPKEVKLDKSMNARITGQTFVKSISPEFETFLKVGDEFNTNAIVKSFKTPEGEWVKEGSKVEVKLIRSGTRHNELVPVKYMDATMKDYLAEMKNISSETMVNKSLWNGSGSKE